MADATAQAGARSALRLRQICLAVPKLAPAVSVLQEKLGLSVAYRDPNLGRFGLENAMLPIGQHQFIEVVAPVQPDTAVHRFLARGQGEAPGAYMLILDCPDPTPFRQRAEVQGIRVVHETHYANYHGVQFHPRDTGAVMLELCHTVGGESLDGPFYPAGPDWQAHVVAQGVEGVAQVLVRSPDPARISQRWAALLQLPLMGRPGMGGKLSLGLGQVVFEPSPPEEAVTEVRLSGDAHVDFVLAGVRFVSLCAGPRGDVRQCATCAEACGFPRRVSGSR